MLAEIIEGIFSVILELGSEIVGYYVGRFVVPIFSLGRLKCDSISSTPLRRKVRWHGLFHRRGRQVYLTAEATAFVGVFVIILSIATGFLIVYFKR